MPGEERNQQAKFHLETFISEHDFSRPPPVARPNTLQSLQQPYQQRLLQLPHVRRRNYNRSSRNCYGPYRRENYEAFTYWNSRFQQFPMQKTAQTHMQKHSYLQPPLPSSAQPPLRPHAQKPLPPHLLPLQTPPEPPDILYELSEQQQPQESELKTSTKLLAPHQQPFMMPPQLRAFHTGSSYLKPSIHRNNMFSCTNARNNNLNTAGKISRSDRSYQNYNEPYIPRPNCSSSCSPKRKKDIKTKIDGQIENKVKKLIWNVDDEKRAYNEEQKVIDRKIRIEFPDYEYKDCVKDFHDNIEDVFFIVPYAPRYCDVTIESGTDIDEVIEDLRETQLDNNKFLRVTKMNEEEDFTPGIINPCAFYISNIPKNNLNVHAKLKAIFPKSENIKIKRRRPGKFYAIISFGNAADAVNSFRENLNCRLGLEKLRIRFLRLKKLSITMDEDENQFENNEKKIKIEDSRNYKDKSDNEGKAISHCNAREQIAINTIKIEKLSSLNTGEVIKEVTNCDFKNTFIKETIAVNSSRESITEAEVKNEYVSSDELPVCLKTSFENHSSVKLANVQEKEKYSEISDVNSTQENDTEKLICWSTMEDHVYSCFSEKTEFRIKEEKEVSYSTITAVPDKVIESHSAKGNDGLMEKKIFIAEACDIRDKNSTKENKIMTEDSNERNLSSKIKKEKIMDENCDVRNVNNDEEKKELIAEDDLQNTKKLSIEDCRIQDTNNEKKSKETVTQDLSAENLYRLAQKSTQDLVNHQRGNKKEVNLETKENKTSDNTKCITDDVKFEPHMSIKYHLLKNMSNHENSDTEKLRNDEYNEKLDAVQLVTADVVDIVEEENTEISINVDTPKNEDRVGKNDIDRKYSLNQLSEGDHYNILTDNVMENEKPHEAEKFWDGNQHLLHQERLNVDLSEFIDIKQRKNLKTEKQATKQSVQETKAVYEIISCITEKTNTENDIREIVELKNMNEEKELALEFNGDSYVKQLTTQNIGNKNEISKMHYMCYKDTKKNNQPFSQESVEVILERNSKNDFVEELNVNADTQVRAQKILGTGVQNDSVLDNSSNCLGESMKNQKKESYLLTREIVDGINAKDKLISLHHENKQRDKNIEISETGHIAMSAQNTITTLTDDGEPEKEKVNIKHKFHAHNFVEQNNQDDISNEQENIQPFQHKEVNIEIYVNCDVVINDNVTNNQGELSVTEFNIKQLKEEVGTKNTLTATQHLKQKKYNKNEYTNMNHETQPVCKQMKSLQTQPCVIFAPNAITTLTDDSELQKQKLNMKHKFHAHNFIEQDNQDDISNEQKNIQSFQHKEVNIEIYVNRDVVINDNVTNNQGELSVTESNIKQLRKEVGARNTLTAIQHIGDTKCNQNEISNMNHETNPVFKMMNSLQTQHCVNFLQNSIPTLAGHNELQKQKLNMKQNFHTLNKCFEGQKNNEDEINLKGKENENILQDKEVNIEESVNSDVITKDNVRNFQGNVNDNEFSIKQMKEEVEARNTLNATQHLKQKKHNQHKYTNMNHETQIVCKQMESSQTQQCVISAQNAITTLTDDGELQKQKLNIRHKFHAHNFVEQKNNQNDISKEEETKKSFQKREINIDEFIKRDVAISDDVRKFQGEIIVNESSSNQVKEIGARNTLTATQHLKEKKHNQNDNRNMNHETQTVCKQTESSQTQQCVISTQNAITTLIDDSELQKQELNMKCEFHPLNNCFGEQKNYQDKILGNKENGKYSQNKEVNTESSERRSIIGHSNTLEVMADVDSKLTASQFGREKKSNESVTMTQEMNPVQTVEFSPTSDIVTTTTTTTNNNNNNNNNSNKKRIRKRKSVIIYNNKLLKAIIDLTGEQTASSDLIENKYRKIENYNINQELKPVQIVESSSTGDIVTNDNSKYFEKEVSIIKCNNKQPEEVVDLRIKQTVLENHREEKFNEIENLCQEMKSVHILELLSADDVVINDELKNFQERINVSKCSSYQNQLKQNIDVTSKLTATQHLEEKELNKNKHSHQNQVMKHCTVVLSKMEDYPNDIRTENKLSLFQNEISDGKKHINELKKHNENTEDKVSDLNNGDNSDLNTGGNSEFNQLWEDNCNEQLKPEVKSKSVNQSSDVKEITHAVSNKSLAEGTTDQEENTERKSYSGCGSTRNNKFKRKKSSFNSNKFANTRANSHRRKKKLKLSVSESDSESEEEEKYVDNEQYELEQTGNLKFKFKRKNIQPIKECTDDIRKRATEDIEERKICKQKKTYGDRFLAQDCTNREKPMIKVAHQVSPSH